MRGGLQQGHTIPVPQTLQMQHSHQKVILTWEPMPKLNSCIISWSPPTPTPTVLSGTLFLWLNGWSHHIWCAIFLNDNMDQHMLNLGILVLEGPWCVFYATRCQVYWGLTHSVVFYWYFIWFAHTQTQTHTAHSEASILTYPYKYMFTPLVMCSQHLPLLH